MWVLEPGKALVSVDLDAYVALVFFDLREGRPLPQELRIVPALEDLDLGVLLRSWNPASGPPLATGHLRAVNLGGLQRDLMRQMHEGGSTRAGRRYQENYLRNRGPGEQGHRLGTAESGSGFPVRQEEFRRPQNFQAAVERCAVALRYEALSVSGSESPTATIADEFFEGNGVRARNVVSAARTDGWLTAAVPGRPYGEATDRCLEFAEVNKKALEAFRRGGTK